MTYLFVGESLNEDGRSLQPEGGQCLVFLQGLALVDTVVILPLEHLKVRLDLYTHKQPCVEHTIQKNKVKVSFYTVQYPVLRTAQNALHFTSLTDLFNQIPSQLLWEASSDAAINV